MIETGLGKRRVSLLAAALVASVLLAVASLSTRTEAQEAGCKGQVVLDAGHGGSDTGAVNRKYGLTEKDQNLDVAYRLEALLEADGYKVCMTRTGDQTLSNKARYTYANTTGAKVLVSIHMNGSSDPGVDYTTALYGKPRKDLDLTNSVFAALANDPGLGIGSRSPYQFASGVLLKSQMPATIAETVFITSDREGQLLSDGTGARQQQIAEALKVGIERYLTAH